MKAVGIAFIAFVISMGSLVAIEAPTEYELIPVIPISETGGDWYVTATSPFGHVAGRNDDDDRVFIYDLDRGFRLIDVSGPVTAINREGIAAGICDMGGDYYPFVSLPDGTVIELATLPEYRQSEIDESFPLAINDLGQVLLAECDFEGDLGEGNFFGRRFLFDPMTGQFQFDVPEDAIPIHNPMENALGQRVENRDIEEDYFAPTLAIFCDGKGDSIELGTLGAEFSTARAINDEGWVVGHSLLDVWDHGRLAAFIWHRETGMRFLSDLVTLEEGWDDLITAHLITNDGLIIGEGGYKEQMRPFIMIPKR